MKNQPGKSRRPPQYRLRDFRPGDIGWIIHRHGVLYANEFGWNQGFEALVAEVLAQFLRNHDPARERCWIAESTETGQILGSVFVVQSSKTVAKLRMLLVEPEARGLGLGTRLVDECIRYSKKRGYKKLILWTNDVLISARRIYEAAGFTLKSEKAHRDFGPKLVGQVWEFSLKSRDR